MKKAIIFDVKEFALNDGGGIRTTVFFKGCPLRCVWCHNPEGLSRSPELYIRQARCVRCGLCQRGCNHPECQPFGRCVRICPQNLISVAGKEWECEELVQKLLSYEDIYRQTGGGVTLSGGEPLLQAPFVKQLLLQLRGRVHCAIETSGYAPSETFREIVALCDFVYMDLKLFDGEEHRWFTGVSNAQILQNAKWLKGSGVQHVFRTPLIPDVTDTPDNLNAIKLFVEGSRWEKLAYNPLAGAKYPNVGRKFTYREKKSGVD